MTVGELKEYLNQYPDTAYVILSVSNYEQYLKAEDFFTLLEDFKNGKVENVYIRVES